MISRKKKSENRYMLTSIHIKASKYKRIKYSTMHLQEELEPTQKIKRHRSIQSDQRRKFTWVHEFVKKIKTRVNGGVGNWFDRSFNRAIRKNLKVDLLGKFPNQQLDYPLLSISRGGADTLEGLQLVVSKRGVAKLSWNKAEKSDGLNRVFIVVFNVDQQRYNYADFTATRSDQKATIYLGKVNSDDGLHCWVFLKSNLKKETSNSQYVHHVITLKDVE